MPTKYTDFLEFLGQIASIREGKGFIRTERLHDGIMGLLFAEYDELNEEQCKKRVDPWSSAFVNNFWFDRFNTAKARDNWVDFEKEIARVIRLVEECMQNNDRHEVDLDDPIECEQDDAFWAAFSQVLNGHTLANQVVHHVRCVWTYQDLRKKLSEDLDVLVIGFERYLSEYVGRIEKKASENIERLIGFVRDADRCHVLTFNYTSTFEELLEEYGCRENADFCYVHGRIRGGDGAISVSDDKNRMVLGISERLSEEERQRFIGFTHFNKFYQRIYKETDSTYMDWLDEIASSEEKRSLWAFGQSMGISDRDILKPFITASGMESTVFYHDEDMFKDQVTNLTEILGSDRIIQMTGGQNRSLRFERQRVVDPPRDDA